MSPEVPLIAPPNTVHIRHASKCNLQERHTYELAFKPSHLSRAPVCKHLILIPPILCCYQYAAINMLLFDRFLVANRSKQAKWSKTGRKVNNNCIRSAKGKTIFLKCSVLLNCLLEIVGDEFVTSIDHFDEFHVNLLFDCSIYRLMCTHMGYDIQT